MTCIVGIQTDEGVWMGADSHQECNGVALLVKEPKVYRLSVPNVRENEPKFKMLVGGCGEHRFFQLVNYALKVPPYDENWDEMTWLVQDFIDALRTCIRDGGQMQPDRGRDYHPNLLMLGFHGRLFIVGGDFAVEDVERPFRAIGCGEDAAMGVLYTLGLALSTDPEQGIRVALEAAAEIAVGVRPPFHIKKL